jgi:hypothetical protein
MCSCFRLRLVGYLCLAATPALARNTKSAAFAHASIIIHPPRRRGGAAFCPGGRMDARYAAVQTRTHTRLYRHTPALPHLRRTRNRPRPHSTVHIHTHTAFVSLANAVSFIFWGAHTVLVLPAADLHIYAPSQLLDADPALAAAVLTPRAAPAICCRRVLDAGRSGTRNTRVEVYGRSGTPGAREGSGEGERRRSCVAGACGWCGRVLESVRRGVGCWLRPAREALGRGGRGGGGTRG